VNGGFRYDIGVQAVAKVNRVDIIAACCSIYGHDKWALAITYHSRSLYMIVKNTCKNKLTAFMTTASKNSHPSPVILALFSGFLLYSQWLGAKKGRWAQGAVLRSSAVKYSRRLEK
jgi:hypothetical protein